MLCQKEAIRVAGSSIVRGLHVGQVQLYHVRITRLVPCAYYQTVGS